MDEEQAHESLSMGAGEETANRKWYTPLTEETKLSKYFSMMLFVVLPLLGFWLGVDYASTQAREYAVAGFGVDNMVTERDLIDSVNETTFSHSSYTTTVGTSTHEATSTIPLKTYRNDELGFEFSYPSDVPTVQPDSLTPDQKEQGLLLHLNFGGGLGAIYFDEDSLTIEETTETDIRHHASDVPIDVSESEQKELIVSLKGEIARITSITFPADEDGVVFSYTLIELIHNRNLFSFFLSGNKDRELTKTILSTYTFLN